MLSNVIGSLSRTIQQYSPPSEWKCVSLVSFHFCFRERYPSKIRCGESIRPTSACSPTASPLHLQYIPRPPPPPNIPPPPPPPYLWSIVTQATSTVFEIRRHFYTFVYGPFKFPLCITVSDSGEYRKSSEINNGVNTLTPKIYKFSRLISEHFLEEIV